MSTAHAAPSVPWMPDIASRHAIELLVDEAGLDLPVMQWPLPRDAVVQALDALPADLPVSLAVARDRVRADLRRQQSALLAVRARPQVDTLAGFGDDATPGTGVEMRSGEWDAPGVALQLGVRAESRPVPQQQGSVLRLDDSAAVTGAYGVQLQAWAHRSWWGPGWQSALALSNNAPALAGVGLQRASASTSESPWLSWLGPWSIEAFVARAEGDSTPAHPFIVGSRFEFRPFSHLEIGIERTAQWGGAGRNQSLHSFADMLLSLHTNADTPSQESEDPANEMAGYDVRVTCPAILHCAIYGQAIGEDSAGGLPSRFLAMGGFEVWSPDGTQRFFVEDARTSAYKDWFGAPMTDYAYRNYAYPSGYTNANRWLGANVGPDSRIATFGWIDADADSTVRVSVGHIGSRVGSFDPTTFDPQSSGRMLAVSARRSFAWGAATWTPELDWYRLDAPAGVRQQARVGLEMSVDLDDMAHATSSRFDEAFAGRHGDVGTQVLVGAALIGGAALLDKPADHYAQLHGRDVPELAVRKVGDVLPFIELGGAGVAWLAASDARAQRVGLTSVESGLTAMALAEGLKKVTKRARPTEDRGPGDFGHSSDGGFPSLHAALAWSVLTPVAQEYDAPWLYGVAGVTNAARVFGRKHWLSDTAAGAVMGYWIGDAFQAHNADGASKAQVAIGPRSVAVSIPFQ